jgi:hypothetical protein
MIAGSEEIIRPQEVSPMEKNRRVVLPRECSRVDSMLLVVEHTATMREASRSHDRQRCGPSVWIDTVSKQWPYPQC